MITAGRYPQKLIKTRHEANMRDADTFVFKNASTDKLIARMRNFDETSNDYTILLEPEEEAIFEIKKEGGDFSFYFEHYQIVEMELSPVPFYDTIDFPNNGRNQLRYHAQFFNSSVPLINFDSSHIVPLYKDSDGVAYGPDWSYFTVTVQDNIIKMAFNDPL